MTHYIPFFTSRGPAQREQAACGAWAEKGEHSAEPACPICRSWLEQPALVPEHVTHYTPYEMVGPKATRLQAVCGAWYNAPDRSGEPTCPECADWRRAQDEMAF